MAALEVIVADQAPSIHRVVTEHGRSVVASASQRSWSTLKPTCMAACLHACLQEKRSYTVSTSTCSTKADMAPAKESTDEIGLRPSVYNPEYLLRQSRWIRDDLDLQVARDGPDALHSNDILTLDEFLRRLLTSNIDLGDIRLSRIHLAIEAIAGKATRWPVKLIDKAEVLRDKWEKQYGSLKNLTVPLYESGGRLYGIARPEDVTNEKLLVKWLKAPGVTVSPQAARRRGDLGFRPGE